LITKKLQFDTIQINKWRFVGTTVAGISSQHVTWKQETSCGVPATTAGSPTRPSTPTAKPSQQKKDMDELQIRGSLLGHVGDGNFHTFVSLDVSDASDMDRFDEYNGRLIRRSLAVGGTCTGEHGIAIGKHLLAVVCEPLANRSLIYA